MSDDGLVLCVNAIRIYEKLAGGKVKRKKSVGLQLDTWRGNSILPDTHLKRWTDVVVILLGVQIEKRWCEVTSEIKSVVQIWFERKLSLLGWAGQSGCTCYWLLPTIHLTALLGFVLNKWEWIFFCFLRKSACEVFYLLPGDAEELVRDVLVEEE